jgi:hypothetical protein
MDQSSFSNELKSGSTLVNNGVDSSAEAQRSQLYSFAINNPLNYVNLTALDHEHLQGRQKELIDEWARRQNEANKTNDTAQQLYDGLSESQRATYESVTHALMGTQLLDKEGKSLGTALDLVKSVETIAGDEKGKGSDEKFRVYVTLNDNAISILKEARGIKVGENGIYHGEYKLSFRQERKSEEKGLEAGWQISATKDGRRGDIDVDYRFGISHLGAGNSDVQDKRNYQKHIDRWPGLPTWSDKKARGR